MQNYYELLGIAKTANKKEIKKAYLKLAKKYHPDLNPNDKEAERIFKEVGEAYQVLSKDDARRDYDAKLAKFEASGGSSKAAGARAQGTAQGQGVRPQRRKKAGEGASTADIDLNNMAKSFSAFWGFDPKSKEVVDEDKLNTFAKEKKKRNPLDTTEMFKKFMGID